MPTKTPTSTVNRELHYFVVGGDNFAINLVKGNYDNLTATLGYTTTAPAATVSVFNTTIGKALKEGLLFPLRVSGKKGTKKATATIYVPRDKIEDAFGASGVKGKDYGGLVIGDVRPVTKRLITV